MRQIITIGCENRATPAVSDYGDLRSDYFCILQLFKTAFLKMNKKESQGLKREKDVGVFLIFSGYFLLSSK